MAWTRNQPQEKKMRKKTNYMKTKQHATKKKKKKTMGQWGNQEGNLKIPWNKG